MTFKKGEKIWVRLITEDMDMKVPGWVEDCDEKNVTVKYLSRKGVTTQTFKIRSEHITKRSY